MYNFVSISSYKSHSYRTTLHFFVLVSACMSCLVVLCGANGSARLIEPAMRSSLWRFNPKAPINFNDQALDCGGPQIQFNLNRGRCGVCGDPYNEQRDNERGGRYASGFIARRYRTGTKVTMIADLVAGNGGGYFEVKLCPRNSPNGRITQACFDKYPLQIQNGKKRRLKIPKNSDNPTGLYRLDVKLPKGVTCTHCVIQWHYHASNEWGYDSDGRGCMGCGPQTEIFNCADVTIGYLGDPEGKLGQTADISSGALAQVYDVYANGQYGTGVSPFILNSGLTSGWASANDLTNSNNNDRNNDNEYDDNQPMMAASLNRQSAGFANFFMGGEGADYYYDNGNNMMSVPDYYNYYDGNDYGLMDPLRMGGGGGESGEGSSFGSNFGRISVNMRTFGGGSGGSSEEGGGGVNFRRTYTMNIPSLSRQYNMMNARRGGGGSSGSSEERVSRVTIPRVSNTNRRRRPSEFIRLRDALRDITNRQNLRNGLHDIVSDLNNRRGGYGGGGSSSGEGFNPGNIPTYFRDRLGRGGGSSDCSGSSSSEEDGCGGGIVRVVDYYPPEPEVNDYYDYTPPEVVEPDYVEPDYVPPVDDVIIPDDTGPDRGDSIFGNGDGLGLDVGGGLDLEGGLDLGGGVGVGGGLNIGGSLNLGGVGGAGGAVGAVDYGDDYGDLPDNTAILDSVGGVGGNGNGNIYQTQEDIDFITNRQAELDRWRKNEEEERQRRLKKRGKGGMWRPPMLPPWPYNNMYYNNIYQRGFIPQQTNPYIPFNTGMNTNLNLNLGLNPGTTNPALSSLSRQYPPWQLPDMVSAMNNPSRLSPPFTPIGYSSGANEARQQESSPASQIFSWMPSANDVMTLGASKSPIFSQKVANQYLSPFLTLSQSHPALRCQRPDQLVCVATSAYQNIPDADNICTTKCRSGGACGSDYCSCACQKSLVCVHQASASIPGGQMGISELDLWCTNQCNAGRCPDQVCACSILL